MTNVGHYDLVSLTHDHLSSLIYSHKKVQICAMLIALIFL